MQGETVVTIVFGAIALVIGGVVTPFRRRHVARMRADRESGKYLPAIDARGIWLLFNGPVTLGVGVALIANGAWRAHGELERARIERELGAISISCVPGGELTITNSSSELRVVQVQARALATGAVDPHVRLLPAGPFSIAPGESVTASVETVREDACGESTAVALGLGAGSLGDWSRCSGLVATIALFGVDGAPIATGPAACSFPGRANRLDFSLFGE